jgi:hypothetical protein
MFLVFSADEDYDNASYKITFSALKLEGVLKVENLVKSSLAQCGLGCHLLPPTKPYQFQNRLSQ